MSSRSADTVYAALVERLVSGALRPGEALYELELVDSFGVSRTPIREALLRLEQSGLAERGPRRALVVRRLDAGDIAELFEAVGEVESTIAAMAALRMTEFERQKLLAVADEGESASGDAYGEINVRFHGLIRDGGHNAVLAATLDDLNLRTLPWRAAQFSVHEPRRATSREEHREIAATILERDADGAREAMRRHIASSFFTLSEILGAPDR
ncbi:GntR family transcriptional regulator [Roseivivax marinus]|uniref:GntR family transcriptional regulator n=1 Tax=Roseivivax marinus TaxID=1379903 RepID=W4HFF5_9RHOB|nr:GntR family transcriptional regulator [Roseivivax marinus]ETW11424.1 GntR family transcriptional regulator [Roseivivax marinus]